jgi:DNA/RNA endonuclease YhcR with UshA esterase domain
MRRLLPSRVGMAWLASVFLMSTVVNAQQKAQSVPQRNMNYDVSREVTVQGVVVSYTENSSTAPLGAHVSVQTSSGTLDAHLGDARLLQANHLTLAAGDSIRVIGENVPYGSGTQFFARIIQKGSQTLALRSTRGFPLRPAAKAGKSEAGVL